MILTVVSIVLVSWLIASNIHSFPNKLIRIILDSRYILFGSHRLVGLSFMVMLILVAFNTLQDNQRKDLGL